jgi:hypothetical protein
MAMNQAAEKNNAAPDGNGAALNQMDPMVRRSHRVDAMIQ